jgi:hypothetical protein
MSFLLERLMGFLPDLIAWADEPQACRTMHTLRIASLCANGTLAPACVRIRRSACKPREVAFAIGLA